MFFIFLQSIFFVKNFWSKKIRAPFWPKYLSRLLKKKRKMCFSKKSKNRDISTQSQYFSLILGQVAVLISTRSPESLSTNGQLWPTFREGFRFQPHKMCTLGSDGDFGSNFGGFLPSTPRKNPVSIRLKLLKFSVIILKLLKIGRPPPTPGGVSTYQVKRPLHFPAPAAG